MNQSFLKARMPLVFHGGSGSELSDIREAVSYGVVKMNIDTDTQYAFTRPIVSHMCEHINGVLKIDGEVGNKKDYDPRSYLKKGSAGVSAVPMAARVSQVVPSTITRMVRPTCPFSA